MQETKKHLLGRACALKAAIDTIDGRWKPFILHELVREPRRFGQLRRLIGSVSHQVLTQQLRELERDGLIAHRPHATVDGGKEYYLTDRGASLGAILDALRDWGIDFLAETELENGNAL